MDDKKYAFLMISFDTPEFVKDLQNKIPEDELYTDDNSPHDYGLEKETHVTLVPCLDNDTKINDIKKYLKEISRYKTILTNISLFKNDDYDVLKCDAQSVLLKDTNKNITEEFPTHSEFKDYHPHLTIAYLKSGMGDKYVKDYLMPLVILEPKSFLYSFYDNKGNFKQVSFTD